MELIVRGIDEGLTREHFTTAAGDNDAKFISFVGHHAPDLPQISLNNDEIIFADRINNPYIHYEGSWEVSNTDLELRLHSCGSAQHMSAWTRIWTTFLGYFGDVDPRDAGKAIEMQAPLDVENLKNE